MAIAKLNAFFSRHHRVIFGIITVLIIIAFTDFLTPGTGIVDAFRGRGASQSVGEIFGKKIGYTEVSEQARLDMLTAQVFMNIPLNYEIRAQLEQQAFFSLANLTAARNAGLKVSDEEVGRFLRVYFQDEKGKFNLENYNRFVNNFLASEGFTEEDLNEAARNYLLLAKLQESQRAAVVVTPGEVEMLYNVFNEEYEVLRAEFDAADYAKSVKVVPAELDAYFAANRKKYIIPAQLQALVVEFAYDKYQTAAAKSLKEADFKAFYEQNKQLFSKVVKDKVETPAYDKVKAQVRTLAIANAAKNKALEAAQQFGSNAYEAAGNAPAEQRKAIFVKHAGNAKLALKATGKFAADSKTAGKIAEAALVPELASVFTDVPISNAVPGAKAAFVGYVTEFVPSREAELKEVKAKVTADFVQMKALEAARARATEVSAALQALAANGRVKSAKSMKAPQFKAVKKFTLLTGSPELGFGSAAVGNMLDNEVSAPQMTANGAQVLVLVKRTPPAKAYTADPAMENMARNYKMGLAQAEYQSWLLSNCVRYQQEQTAEAAQ